MFSINSITCSAASGINSLNKLIFTSTLNVALLNNKHCSKDWLVKTQEAFKERGQKKTKKKNQKKKTGLKKKLNRSWKKTKTVRTQKKTHDHFNRNLKKIQMREFKWTQKQAQNKKKLKRILKPSLKRKLKRRF